MVFNHSNPYIHSITVLCDTMHDRATVLAMRPSADRATIAIVSLRHVGNAAERHVGNRRSDVASSFARRRSGEIAWASLRYVGIPPLSHLNIGYLKIESLEWPENT